MVSDQLAAERKAGVSTSSAPGAGEGEHNQFCDHFLPALISHPVFSAFGAVLLQEKPKRAVTVPQIPPCRDPLSALKCKSGFTQFSWVIIKG